MNPYDIGLIIFGSIAVAGIVILLLEKRTQGKGRS